MHESPQISPEYKSLTPELIRELPKVVVHHRVSVDGLRQQVQALAEDGVVYAELLLEVTTQEELDRALPELDVPGIDARLVLSAANGGGVVEQTARLVSENYGPKVLGFNLSGVDEEHLASHYAAALLELRVEFIPFSVDLGVDAGVRAIGDAVLQGAVRLGNGVRIFEDFAVDLEGIHPARMSAWVRDRRILLAMAPSRILDEEADITDHPLPLLQDLGFACAVHPGTGSLSDEWIALNETFDYGPEEFFDLCANAAEQCFAGQELRDELLVRQILPGYEQLDPDPEDELG